MKNKDNPRRVDERNWYYGPINSRVKHIEFVHQVYSKTGEYIQTDIVKIPMRFLRDTLFLAALKAKRKRGAKR